MIERLDIAHGPLDSDDSYSLAVVRSAGGVVFGRKTRGFGSGRLVLPGGKDCYYISGSGIGLIPGTVDASREVFEETGLDIDPGLFTQAAMLAIDTEDDTKTVAVYRAHCRQTPLKNSSELSQLDWYDEQQLPYDEMPPDYIQWLPHVLAGYAVTAFLETDDDELVGGMIYRQQLVPLVRAEMIPIKLSQL